MWLLTYWTAYVFICLYSFVWLPNEVSFELAAVCSGLECDVRIREPPAHTLLALFQEGSWLGLKSRIIKLFVKNWWINTNFDESIVESDPVCFSQILIWLRYPASFERRRIASRQRMTCGIEWSDWRVAIFEGWSGQNWIHDRWFSRMLLLMKMPADGRMCSERMALVHIWRLNDLLV